MIRRLLLFSFATRLSALPAVWIDLSGTWTNITEGGRADRIQIPLQSQDHRHLRTLERILTLPPEALGRPLALTVGPIGGAYDIDINGTRVATTGPLNVDTFRFPQPRTFLIPPMTQPTVTISLKVVATSLPGSRGWRPEDNGPWLLTSPEAAPKDAAALTIARQKLLRIGDLTQPLLLLCLAVVVWLIYLKEPGRYALLWLGLLLVSSAVGRLWIYLGIGEHTTPFRYGAWLELFRTQLPIGLFAHLACSILNAPRWLLWPVWALALGAQAAGSGTSLWAAILLGDRVLVLAGIAVGYWRTQPRRGWLALSLALTVAASASANMLQAGLPGVDEAFLFGFRFAPNIMLITVLSFVITAELVRDLLKDREVKLRLTADLEAARNVQRVLLPTSQPVHGAFETETSYQPAFEVGGDFYLVEPLEDGAVIALVGDVSGKGLKAAMVVSLVVGALRNRRSNHPASVLQELNRVLRGQLDGGFVTCIVVRIEASGAAVVASAGHPSPYLGGKEVAVEQGLPLGIVPDAEYSERTFTLDSQLTLVSDGVLEAANAKGELFGFDRTCALSDGPAPELAKAAETWGQNDDITVVTVRRVV